MMRKFSKKIMRFLGFVRAVQLLRSLSYAIFDFLGTIVFTVLKLVRVLPLNAKFDKSQVKKVLIIRNDRIGDLVLSTPAIRAVGNTFSGAQVHCMVNEYAKDLIVNNPYIHKIFTKAEDTSDKDYDLAIALHAGLRQNYLVFKSGAFWRVGYTGWGGKFFLTHCLKDDRLSRARHEVEFTLEAVEAIGCTTADKRLEVSVTEEGETFAEQFFADNALDGLVVLIHPGARQQYVRWKKEGFAEVADRLRQRFQAKVIISGANSERLLIKDIVSLMKYPPVVCQGVRLTHLVSIIKRSSLYLGNITGPMHIAAALDIPIVAITGMKGSLDDIRYWGPRCSDYEIVSKDTGCRQCRPGECRTIACMQQITADDVFQAAEKIISRHGPRN